MKATTFFNKDEKAPESGGEAVIESGKLYILTLNQTIHFVKVYNRALKYEAFSDYMP